MPTPTKAQIAVCLNDLLHECKPGRLSNTDSLLAEAFIWQEVMEIADRKYKEAMAEVNAEIPNDEALRKKAEGEHSVWTGNNFCLIAKIGAAKNMFDKETFMATVARKFRIPLAKLQAQAEFSKKPSKASLSKRIVEL